MSTKAESGPGPLDTILLLLAAAVLVGGIAAYYVFEDESLPLRVAGVLVSLAIGTVIAMRSAQGQNLWRFIQGSRVEIRKVIWPTRQEALQTTLTVLVFALILGIFFWGLDFFLLWGTRVLTGVEMFRKLLDEGQAGDNVGVLLRGTKRDEVERGQVLAKPGSITPHTKFEAEVYVLTKEEGGRHTPFFKGYRPQFYFRTTDVTGAVELPEGTEMVMPGDNIQMKVELIAPIAMEDGLRFAIREGGRTVGAGVVAKIIE